ncbi:MAG: hypothetical protein R2881_09785 [Eubacteriales bacterium]
MSTLLDFKFQRFYRATAAGQAGALHQQKRQTARHHVPVGAIVRDVESGSILADMSEANKERVILHGGRGGKGNAKFATPTRQAPLRAAGHQDRRTRGGARAQVRCEWVSSRLPSVGKSTISVLTAAKPKSPLSFDAHTQPRRRIAAQPLVRARWPYRA